MMQRRVQKLDLFTCQIDKGENELGLCTRIFFDPADKDKKEPGVFITEIVEGSAAHTLGCIQVFDQIIKIGDTNLIGLHEEEIFSAFKKVENCVFQIEIGRESPEIKSELITLLELSEEKKKYFMDSVSVQEKVGDITIVKESRNVKTPVSWIWMVSELEFVVVVLKKLIEEECQEYRKDLKALHDKFQANNLQDKHKKCMNTSEVNMEDKFKEEDKEAIVSTRQLKHKPDTKKDDISQAQSLAPVDFNSDTRIEKEEQRELVIKEEISNDKPTVEMSQRSFFWFRYDKQVKNMHKQEETDQKVLDDVSTYTGAPRQLVSDWTEIQVGNWLRSIGMKKYVLRFDLKRINGQELLRLDNNGLKCIGIQSKGDQKKLLKNINKIRKIEEDIILLNIEIMEIQGKEDMAKRRKCTIL